jgi:hypothetical protein
MLVGAFAAAGCGGSSSTTSSATGTTTTGASTAPPQIPQSTPIASSRYLDILVQGLQKRGMSSSQAQSAAHCIQDGLTKEGFKTQADAKGSNAKKAFKVIVPCVQKAKGQ